MVMQMDLEDFDRWCLLNNVTPELIPTGFTEWLISGEAPTKMERACAEPAAKEQPRATEFDRRRVENRV
jgi:hypothetical protein